MRRHSSHDLQLTFGDIQKIAAQQIGVSITGMLAVQVAGATMGNCEWTPVCCCLVWLHLSVMQRLADASCGVGHSNHDAFHAAGVCINNILSAKAVMGLVHVSEGESTGAPHASFFCTGWTRVSRRCVRSQPHFFCLGCSQVNSSSAQLPSCWYLASWRRPLASSSHWAMSCPMLPWVLGDLELQGTMTTQST